MKKGQLIVVGTGIKAIAHITVEAQQHIEKADQVLYLTPGSLMDAWIKDHHPDAVSLSPLYNNADRARLETYQLIHDRILQDVRQSLRVCAVFYGHPGVFVLPAVEAVKTARSEGHIAHLLPGISAEDCLFADLGVDPAVDGCQTYEATDFLIRPRVFSPHAGLILWQIGAIGSTTIQHDAKQGLRTLADKLLKIYPDNHAVVVYEAARHPMEVARREYISLSSLPEVWVTAISTLYVPALKAPEFDSHMLDRLGLSTTHIHKKW